MDEFLIALLAAAGAILTGRSVLFLFDRVLGTRGTPRPIAEVWGTSILLGVSFTASAGFVWCDMGQELGPHYSWRQVIIGGLLGILAFLRSRGLVANAPPQPMVESTPRQKQIISISRVIVCASVLAAFVLTLRNNEPANGVRSTIENRARMLFEARTTYTPELTSPEAVTISTRDPMMLPLFERHVYALLGRVSQPWARIWLPVTFAGLLLSFVGVIGRRVHPVWGWGSAAVIALILPLSSMVYETYSALPALPVVCFHGVAVLYLWDAWQYGLGRERIRCILLAASMAASASFTRYDGVVLLLVDCLSWGLTVLVSEMAYSGDLTLDLSRIRPGRNLLAIVFFVLFAAFLCIPWMRYRAKLPLITESMSDTSQFTATATSSTLESAAFYGTLWTLTALVVWWNRRSPGNSGRFLILNVLLSFVGLLAIHYIAPRPFTATLGVIDASSFLALIPSVVLLAATAPVD